MRSALLIDVTDLEHWASRRDSQAVLPDLVRRLVLATSHEARLVSFRAGEGVQLSGWDGIVQAEQASPFVPDGVSCWEMGTGDNPGKKADADYKKRTANPRGLNPAESTFVFVTPRRWPTIREWVQARRAEGIWRDVRAYDADELQGWLTLAPAVHLWLSILLGKHPEGAQDLESFWADWAAATRPITSPDLVLAGRSDVLKRVADWLSGLPSFLTLQAESREEALAVFAAILQRTRTHVSLCYPGP